MPGERSVERMDAGLSAIILCGGLGTRLREETEYRPKPMVEIGNRPMLWHVMKIYAAYGIRDFILCLGYKGHVIKSYFLNYEALNNDFVLRLGPQRQMEILHNESAEDWRVILADTGDSALKGARIKRVEKYVVGDRFMLTYGDGLANIDLRRLYEFHMQHGRIGTVTGVRPPSRFGELLVEDGIRVESFLEKPQVSDGMINGGFFVFERRVFDYFTSDDSCELESNVLERLAREGQLMVYVHDGEWACMDTYRDLLYLNELWRNGRAFWQMPEAEL